LELHEEARELPGKLALSVGGSIWSFSGGEWSMLTHGKTDVQPAWNRRTGRLYFIRRSADHSDVYTRSARGDVRRLSANQGRGKTGTKRRALSSSWAWQPSVGPKDSLVVLTDRGGELRVAEMRASRELRTLAGGNNLVQDPQVSPDGRRVAYVEYVGGAARLMVRQQVEGGAAAPVATFKRGLYDPEWSLDGRSIYFVAPAGGSTRLYIVAPGGKPRALTNGDAAVRQPTAVGPNRLVYLQRNGDAWRLAAAKVERDDGGARLVDETRLSTGEGLDPSSNLAWRP